MTEPDRPLAGKTCMVTGATSGIGLVAAEALARQGASVVLVGRDRQKAQATADQIRRSTGNPAVEFLLADLSSQAEVRRLAGEFLRRHPTLNVLVNNAGAYFGQRTESVDGIEMTFALNHLSYFLLTNLLLDALKAGAPSRVVNVSSEAHDGAKLDFDDLQGRGSYSGWRAYGRSKLANILFTAELAKRLEGTGVAANSLHPGFVATNFFAGHGLPGWVVRRIAGLLAISPEEGARTTIHLATSPEVEGVSGLYFVKSEPARPSSAARDEAAARRLWRVSEELTGLASVPA